MLQRQTVTSLLAGIVVAATCAAPARSVSVRETASGNARLVASIPPHRATRSHLRPMATPPGCSSDAGAFFIGVSLFNYARNTSGVVAGGNNQSCDALSAIGAGGSNVIGGDASSDYSMIGAGTLNASEQSPYSFIGAGTKNAISGGTYSAIAAGQSNSVGATNSFVGAGIQNTVGPDDTSNPGNPIFADYAFIGSGYGNAVGPNFAEDDAAISGGQLNLAEFGADDAIGGGYEQFLDNGSWETSMGGYQNELLGNYGVVLGGSGDQAQNDYDTLVGGLSNVIAYNERDGGSSNFLGGGTQNIMSMGSITSADPTFSVVLGGNSNLATTASGSLNSVVIVGGTQNQIGAAEGVIVGGYGNGDGPQGYIGGGYANSAGSLAAIGAGHANAASGNESSIVGGSNNTASNTSATVPGGQYNVVVGVDSFAAGTSSQAINSGTFVWSDDAAGAKTLASTAQNQFRVRASAGITLYSSANLKSGVKVPAGSGSWSNVSDRNVKIGIRPLDDTRMLAQLAALPVTTWSYASQGAAVRHIGPMAQDFRVAFGLGEDATHISTVDEEGVALAAVRALAACAADKDRELSELQAAHAARRTVLADLAARVAAIESSRPPAEAPGLARQP